MKEKRNTVLAGGVLLIAVLGRLIPHTSNFTPVESVALFAGAYLSARYFAFLLPLIVLYLTDLFLNNTILRSFYTSDEGIIWYKNYMLYSAVSLIAIVAIGSLIKGKIKLWTVGLGALSGSLLFFLVSNFGVWIHSTVYPKSMTGLVECYTLALPFLRNSILSNLLFTAVLFGAYEWAKSKVPSAVEV